MPEKPTKSTISIVFDHKTKEFKSEGPMRDPVLYLGMLELARARYVAHLTMNEIEQREKLKQKIQVVPAGALGPN